MDSSANDIFDDKNTPEISSTGASDRFTLKWATWKKNLKRQKPVQKQNEDENVVENAKNGFPLRQLFSLSSASFSANTFV
ncbi:hypothetical protein L596_013939 [Steinernema carpocapsae]|uniref:Uncharacterized protein n=1 Tax=Steinernema carpocapsae TaxID=34508 RepID=A0A4U5NBL1_STECR|nr:hypothetical protein L596_013939 [Steinernema carpocapsae]